MTDTLHDQREPGFFIVDNEVLDLFGPQIGVYGFAVYCVLAKYANKKGEGAFPSYQAIADMVGMSRPKAFDGVKLLVKCGLVVKTPRFSETGDQTTNAYTLVNVKALAAGSKPDLPPPSKRGLPPPVNVVYHPSKPRLHDQDPINKTQLDQDKSKREDARRSVPDAPAEPPPPTLTSQPQNTQPQPPTAPPSSEAPPTNAFGTPLNDQRIWPDDPPPRPVIPTGKGQRRPPPSSPHLDPRKLARGFIPPGTGATAVEVYYERFPVGDDKTRLAAPLEDDLVRHCPDLPRLRTVIEAYSRTPFKQRNIQLILDWYRDGVPDKQKERNPSRASNQGPAPRPKPNRIEDLDPDSQLTARLLSGQITKAEYDARSVPKM